MQEVAIEIDNDGCVRLIAESPWLSPDGVEWTASGYRLEVMGVPVPVDAGSPVIDHYVDALIEAYKKETWV